MSRPRHFLRLPDASERKHSACPTWIIERQFKTTMNGQPFDGLAIEYHVFRLGPVGAPIVLCNSINNQPLHVFDSFQALRNYFVEQFEETTP